MVKESLKKERTRQEMEEAREFEISFKEFFEQAKRLK